MHPKRASNEATRASAHILNLFYSDPFTQSLMPKANPVTHPATKELTALQIRLTSLENTLANVAKASAEAAKVMKKNPPPTTPAQNPTKPPSTKTPGPPPTYASKAATPQRPSLLMDTSSYTWPDPKPSPADICATINASLETSNPTQVRLAAVKWTPKGNLVLWGNASTTTQQLSAALPHISEALQPTLATLAHSAPQHPPTLRHNVKWSRLRINSVPTGTSEKRGAYTPLEVDQALRAENPSYAALTIAQRPSWVKNPSQYSAGSVSSLSFSFEDPDGTVAQQLLRARTMFAFGHVITIKRWQSTPPKKDKPKKPQTETQTSGPSNNTPAEQAPPSVYNFAPLPSTQPEILSQRSAYFDQTRKAAEEVRRERRRGPLRK